ncbi:MAG TPA: hypothetical protein VLL97_14970 [Acidobacteriota bacterium]|nr:hypothetical protein [Acidobacteriota bacterium]
MKRCLSLILGFSLPLILMNPCHSLSAEDIILPEGTRIVMQLNDTLSTRLSNEGDTFTAVITVPVYSGDRVVIPKGSIVRGGISRILRPGRFKGKAVMNLLFQSIAIPGRGHVPFAAVLVRIDPDDGLEVVRAEKTVETKKYGGGEAAKDTNPRTPGAGTMAKGGAANEAVPGGETGVTVGKAAIFSSLGKELEIHRGYFLDIALIRPLTIPSEKNGGR